MKLRNFLAVLEIYDKNCEVKVNCTKLKKNGEEEYFSAYIEDVQLVGKDITIIATECTFSVENISQQIADKF